MNSTSPQEFIVSNYLHLLKPSNPKDKSKYFCPICGGNDFSIAQTGKRAGKAYGCKSKNCATNKIAYELRKLNGEFDGKEPDPWETGSNELLQLQIATATGYDLDEDGQPIIKPSKPSKSNSDNKKSDGIPPQSQNPNYLYKQIKSGESFVWVQIFKLSLVHEVIEFIEEKYESSEIKYNIRTKGIEIYGEKISIDTVRAKIGQKHQVTIAKDILEECFLLLARKNQYDPVKQFLELCTLKHPLITSKKLLEGNLAKKLFGCDDPIYQVYLNIFLVSACKRVFEPGCKIDLTLILQGAPGLGKTSFFDILGNGFFSSSMSEKLDKDDKLLASRNWLLEWGELESFTAKEYKSTIKNFLTIREDSLRVPYGRDTEVFPRNFLIAGTTNEPTFLTDPDGNRRFMIIPVLTKLDRNWLEENLTMIWASGMALYKAGYSTQLNDNQERQQAKENRKFDKVDPWHNCISTYLKSHAEIALENPNHHITAKELWTELERYFDPNFHYSGDRGETNRLGDIMRRLGWKSEQKWLERKNITVYKFIGTIDLYSDS